MHIKQKKRGLALAALLAVVWLLPLPFAADAAEYRCEISIPANVTVTSEETAIPEDETAFVLEVVTADAPMPQDVEITVAGGESGSFGPIAYTEPGDYEYKVYQKSGSEKYFTYDASVYQVTVRVTNTDDGGLTAIIWAVKDGSGQKVDKIEFLNAYKPPAAATTKKKKTTGTVARKTATKTTKQSLGKTKTGDASQIRLWASVAGLSALCLVLFVFAGRRKEECE